MSGMIYAVIVVMWAAFLVPMWLRRHDEHAETKSVDRFASKMRVLSRRTGAENEADARPAAASAKTATTSTSASTSASPARPVTAPSSGTVSNTVRIVGGERRALRDAWADEADEAALAVLAAPDLARNLARDRGLGQAPASLAARRRRVLAALGLATICLVVLAAFSVVPWLVAAPSAVATIAYVVHLRVQAKRTREIAHLRARTLRFRQAADAASGGSSRRSGQPSPLANADLVGDDGEAESAWQPVSVPVPTYVTAPRASRAIRRIDLRSDDAWTSGRLVADAAAAGRAAAAAAHQESVAAQEAEDASVQRAVGH